MVFSKNIKLFVFFIFFISFFSISFSVGYPSFNFVGSNYPSGVLNISGTASSGTIIELSVNSNYISSQNLLGAIKIANLSNGILDTSISIGTILRFVNNKASQVFLLNISGYGFSTINPDESYEFSSYNLGQVSYSDENTLIRKTISVIDSSFSFNFENIAQNYLNDGVNSAQFVIKSLKDNSILLTKNLSFNYDKYPIKISLINFSNVTNQKEILVQGVITDSSSPLKYILNYDGVISNLGMLNSVVVRADGSFNFTIPNLVEGNNLLRFISLDKNNNEIFNGENKFNLLVDTQIPQITIVSATYDATINSKRIKRNADFSLSEMFVNGNNLILNISTDAKFINYTLNSQNLSCPNVLNSSTSCRLNLVNGQNNLTFYAIDIAGNIFKEAHVLNLDSSPISLKVNTLKPKSGSTVHFFLQDVEGSVNKGAVKIEAFTIPQDAKYFTTDNQGVQRENIARCSDFKFLGLTRDAGYLDYSVYFPQINPTDKQISLLDLVSQKVVGTSDGNGYFNLKNLVLKERQMYAGYQNSNAVTTTRSPNIICFVMSDKFGNVNAGETILTLDGGNTQWSPSDISLTPNTVYAAEIEQISNSQNSRSTGGYVRFGLIGHLKYSGPGKLKNVLSPLFSVDTSNLYDSSRYVRVVQSEMHFKIDKRTNDLIFYFPVEVLPMNKKPLDYPKSLNLGFQVSMGYSVEGKNIPIDTVNPVYFQTQLNIERPLDTAKWLSPAMLDRGINFLNKSIKFTKTAKKYLGIAAVGGVLTCTGAKFYYGAQIAAAKVKGGNGMQNEINGYKHDLYQICDRVVCSAAPAKCLENQQLNVFNFKDKNLNPSSTDLENERQNVEFTGVGKDKFKVLARVNNLNCVGGGNCVVNGKPGIYCSADFTNFKESTLFSSQYKFTSKEYNPKVCTEAIYDFSKASKFNNKKLVAQIQKDGNLPSGFTKKPKAVNLKGISNSCYSPGAPKFDDTRALGQSGVDPKDGLIDSIQAGCITDTYSHVSKYLLIQEEIKKCLQGAKIGIAKGAYCERLLSQAVCDVATYGLFKTASEKAKRTIPETHTENGFLNIVNGASIGDSLLNDRYSNSKFFSEVGLSSDKVVKNVCLAAITGDWTILTDNILGAVDKNQVKPSFGPPIPESRMQSYDPLTGDLSIMYRFTYAGVSGGQIVDTKVELLCDPSESGAEYCPPNTIISSADPNSGSRIPISNLYISQGSFKQENVVLFDTTAKYRYNVLKLTHTYQLDGKTVVLEQRDPIISKGVGMIFNCQWNSGVSGSNLNKNSGYGISCDSLFGPTSSVSVYRFAKDTHLSPRLSNVYFPGNSVYLNLNYDVRSSTKNFQDGFDLVYRADCNAGSGRTVKVGNEFRSPSTSIGNDVFSLFTIPNNLGSALNSKFSLFNLKLSEADSLIINESIKNPNKFVGIEAINTNGLSGQSFNIIDFTGGQKASFLLGQNLVINGVSESTTLIKNLPRITIPANKRFEFKSDRIVLNTLFYLVYGDLINESKLEIVGSIPFSAPDVLNLVPNKNFENLAEGSCNLDIKILPPGRGDLITYDTFDNISATGNSQFINSNLNSKSNLNSLKLNFVVKDTSKSAQVLANYLEITNPIKDRYVCVAPGKNLDVNYVFQGPEGILKNGGVSLEMNLIALRNTLKFLGSDGKSPINKKLLKNEYNLVSFIVPKDINILDKTLDMKLNYVLKNNKNTNKPILLDKNINFKLKISDKCAVAQSGNQQILTKSP